MPRKEVLAEGDQAGSSRCRLRDQVARLLQRTAPVEKHRGRLHGGHPDGYVRSGGHPLIVYDVRQR